MKNISNENPSLCKKYRVQNDINKASDSTFTVSVQCVYRKLQHKHSDALELISSLF